MKSSSVTIDIDNILSRLLAVRNTKPGKLITLK